MLEHVRPLLALRPPHLISFPYYFSLCPTSIPILFLVLSRVLFLLFPYSPAGRRPPTVTAPLGTCSAPATIFKKYLCISNLFGWWHGGHDQERGLHHCRSPPCQPSIMVVVVAGGWGRG